MALEIITQEDLERFGERLTENIKSIIQGSNNTSKQEEIAWIKSHQVQRMLGISPGTLQTLRINGTIPYTKIGGVIFYDKGEITKVLQSNMRNSI